jgi:HlyD family secretion protein
MPSSTAPRGRRRRTVAIAAAAAIVGVVGVAFALNGRGRSAAGAPVLVAAKEGPLTISVVESGTVKNREQVVIKSEVEGRAAIIFLVKEGTHVKAGDLLVELDGSSITDRRAQQQITVIHAEAAFIRARENLDVTKSQSESDVAKADLDFQLAELDLKKYVEGDFPQAVRQAEAEITLAAEEVQRASEKLSWSRRLHAQRYLSLMELQADELAHKKAQLELDLAKERKRLLEDFSHRRELAALRSAVDQARMALDRVRRKSAADLVQAEADLKAKESEFQRQKAQLEKLDDQLRKTKIRAPVDGMVVYATTGQSSWRGDQQPLAEGQEVLERQELIYLPTADSMMAEVKVHESSLNKVRVGLPARVTVDAVPGRVYAGRVERIAVLPDATSRWMNPDLKVYSTEIHLDDGEGLRAGMSCRAEVLVESYPSAVYVPVQCVVREGNQPVVYRPGPDGPRPVPVTVGLDNNRMIRVLSGLSAGDEVLLDPPLRPAAEKPGGAAPPRERARRAPEAGEGGGERRPEGR